MTRNKMRKRMSRLMIYYNHSNLYITKSTMAPISPEKIIEDKDTLLSPKEKKELREYMKKNPTEVQKQAVVSLENNYKIKDLLNTKKPAEMNREEIAVVQLYANLLGKKISVDGIY